MTYECMWGRVKEQKGRQKSGSRAGGFLAGVKIRSRETHDMQLRIEEISEGEGGEGNG